MKKLISLILVLATVLCSFPIAASELESDSRWTGEYTWNGAADGTGVDNAEALYFEEPPTIDGYVSEEEWGERTLEFHSDYWWDNASNKCLFNSEVFFWEESDKLNALIWLRWDEDYFYVAALVDDNDGHHQPRTKDNLHNGDSLAFRVDPKGSKTIDAYGNTWSDEDNIAEFLVAHTSLAGGYTDVYENTHDRELVKELNPVFGEALAVVAPSQEYSKDPVRYTEDTQNGYTTYEIAVPWKYIFQNDLVPAYSTLTEDQKEPYTLQYTNYDSKRNRYGGIGYKLGMSLSIIDSNQERGIQDGGFVWGSGISNLHNAFYSLAGSNQVTLVGDKVEINEYKKYDPSVLDRINKNPEFDNLFYDYLSGDTANTSPYAEYDQLSALTYDYFSDLQYWGSADLYQGSIIDVGGEHGKVLNYDRVLKSYIDSNDKIHEAGVDPIEQFYIDTSISWYEAYRFPLSYTLDFDVMYTSTDMAEPDRASELGNWFGGKNSYEYYCGYDFEEQAFIIRESFNYDTEPFVKVQYVLEKNTWYNWKFQYDNESCTVRLYIDDQLIFDVQNKFFNYSQESGLENGCLLIWWFINTQIKMDNVRMYNFYDFEKEVPVELYGLKGYIHSARSNNGSKEPIYINIYKEGSDEVFRTLTVSRSGSYDIPNLLDKNYRIEFSQKECLTMTYDICLDDGENTLDVVLTRLYDIDFDGFITSADALKFKKYFVKLIPESEMSMPHSDLCEDGVLNAKDLLKLRKRLSW